VPPAFGLATALGRALWLSALSAGVTVLGVVSHMGADSRRGTYSVISVQELQTTGAWTVVLWLGVLCAVGLAARLERGLRERALNVSMLVTALMASGLFWSIAATVLEQSLGLERFGALAALGSFAGLILWVRLLTMGFRGALFGRA
jgi:cation transport ATPase